MEEHITIKETNTNFGDQNDFSLFTLKELFVTTRKRPKSRVRSTCLRTKRYYTDTHFCIF